MLQVALDLRAEADELHAFLGSLAPDDWERPTLFNAWTPWDVVAHLHFFDEVSVLALEDVSDRESLARRQRSAEGKAAGRQE